LSNRHEGFLVERGLAHEPTLVGEDLVLFVEGGDRFRGLRGVAADEGQRGRALQQPGELLLAGFVGRQLGQAVLDDPEAGVGLAELRAQLGCLGNADTAVVDSEDRLRCLDLGGNLLDGG